MKRKPQLHILLLLFFLTIRAYGEQPAMPLQESIATQLNELKGVTALKKEHPDFKEYYELTLEQPLDHFNTTTRFFKQRVFLGFNNAAAPTVMETEGYAAGKISKPQFIKDCNYINVEHRYFGKSLPENPDWKYLTIKQATSDLHAIRKLFAALLKGKWLTTGISKGGQTAIAYKMYFPEDADATIANVTPVKNSIHDPRLSDFMKVASQTECGKKVNAFQRYAFRNKNVLLKEFANYVKEKKLSFGTMSNEIVFEYLLLEYPFAFAQNCFNCNFIPDTAAIAFNPDTAAAFKKIIDEITTVVPPRFYSEQFRQRLEPSFYMFYHELGYYEYDLAPVKQWLSAKSYPNSIFAPAVPFSFDPAYLTALNKFIADPATEKIIFIYGEEDPYTSLQPALKNNKSCFKFIVKNGCHKSRIADLDSVQQKEAFTILSGWLSWPVGN